VAAANPGDTIRVCPGAYEDDVTITKPLTIRGARAGESYGFRTFGSPSESTVNGSFSVQAPRVTIDGFSLSNPRGWLGITVATAGDAARIANNIINGIGDDTQSNNATGISLEGGPDRVAVTGNWIGNVVSQPTAQGVLVGDSGSTDPSLDVLITGNLIENVRSVSTNPDLRGGAYGVQVNNGADATGYATVTVFGNVIRRLTGDWAHAIGLEGPTPGASVIGNAISHIVDRTPDPIFGQNAIAVFFEDNPYFATATVHYNNFDVTDAAAGIAVNAPLTSSAGAVDGRCNWWDSWTGPSGAGPGFGAKVSANVDYAPWLMSPAPFGRCRGGSTGSGDGPGHLQGGRGDPYDH
jgi:nitrous oxidase accessory protein NosD